MDNPKNLKFEISDLNKNSWLGLNRVEIDPWFLEESETYKKNNTQKYKTFFTEIFHTFKYKHFRIAYKIESYAGILEISFWWP
jgi:hypothetical protein